MSPHLAPPPHADVHTRRLNLPDALCQMKNVEAHPTCKAPYDGRCCHLVDDCKKKMDD